MKIVYICSPLKGDILGNIKKAQEYCREATLAGVMPLASHVYFTSFLDDTVEEERELGMRLGLQMLKLCSELWVYGYDNPSEGMRAEIELAKKLGIPVVNAGIVSRAYRVHLGQVK
jgi:hypothetical protein